MIDQVENILVDMKDKLSRLSRLCDGLKALKFNSCSENFQQIPPVDVCQPSSRSPDVGYYSASVNQNTRTEQKDFTKIWPSSFNLSPADKVEEKTLPVASNIYQSEEKYHHEASSDVVTEASQTDEVKDGQEKVSSAREIMMMMGGEEVKIISVRPKLIKKKC